MCVCVCVCVLYFFPFFFCLFFIFIFLLFFFLFSSYFLTFSSRFCDHIFLHLTGHYWWLSYLLVQRWNLNKIEIFWRFLFIFKVCLCDVIQLNNVNDCIFCSWVQIRIYFVSLLRRKFAMTFFFFLTFCRIAFTII